MEFINLLATQDTLCSADTLPIFKFVGAVITVIKIIVPIILVVMGSIDLAKAVMAQKEDEIKKAYTSLLKRVMVGIVIFFLPSIVAMVIGLVTNTGQTGATTSGDCWKCATGSCQ